MAAKQPGEELMFADVAAAQREKDKTQTAKRRWKRISKSNEVSAQEGGKAEQNKMLQELKKKETAYCW